jgi:hypothetical protein
MNALVDSLLGITVDASVDNLETFVIGGFKFQGPILSSAHLPLAPGILMIVKVRNNGTIKPLSLYSTANLRSSAALELAYYQESGRKITVSYMLTDSLTAQMSASLAIYLSEKFELVV